MAWAVTLHDLVYTHLIGQKLTIWADCKVAKNQSIVGRRILCLELGKKHAVQPADPGLVDSTRMMRHQAGQAPASTLLAQKPGAIQGVESGKHQTRRVPDVVHPGRRHQQLTRHIRQPTQPLRLGCHRLDMTPPARQGVRQLPHGKISRYVPTHHDRDGTRLRDPARITPSQVPY